MIEETIFSILSEHEGLTALVGQRVYPLVLPESEDLPAVVWQRVAGGQISSTSGFSGIERPRIQFSCWGSTYAEAKATAAQLRDAIESSSLKSVPENDIETFEDANKVFRCLVDYQIWSQ